MGVAAPRIPLLKFLEIAAGESRHKKFSAFRPKIGIITTVLILSYKAYSYVTSKRPPLIFFEKFSSPLLLLRPPFIKLSTFLGEACKKLELF